MNVKQLVTLAVLAVVGGAAMADDITVSNERFVAYKSRAEMRAEVSQARAAGELAPMSEAGRAAPAAAPSPLTREQVRATLHNAPRAAPLEDAA
jgi:hypothetical protein